MKPTVEPAEPTTESWTAKATPVEAAHSAMETTTAAVETAATMTTPATMTPAAALSDRG
jgi:hypothetical protein